MQVRNACRRAIHRRGLSSSSITDPERILHRECIRPNGGLDEGPGDGSSDRKSFPCTRGVGADRRGAAAVAQIIEKDVVAPIRLRR